MPDLARIWNRDEVLALPDDGNRYELVDGELLVSPSPRPVHQIAIGVFSDRLRPYARVHGVGLVLSSPADLDLRAGQLVQPDIFVVPSEVGSPLRDWKQVGIPMLVVEVLSPSTARHDLIIKRRQYQRSGVPVYWVVDLDVRAVEVWRRSDRSPTVAVETLTWQPDESVAPLAIDLPDCFREIWVE